MHVQSFRIAGNQVVFWKYGQDVSRSKPYTAATFFRLVRWVMAVEPAIYPEYKGFFVAR